MTSLLSQVAVPGRIGPYELIERIGRGGMGSVYLAWDPRQVGAQRWAAVKIIHAYLAKDPAFTAMFLDESHIASEVSHPNVCRVMDYGRNEAGIQFIAMEYLCGATLSAVRARVAQMECDTRRLRALPGMKPVELNGRRAAIMAHMLADACEGLHALHELTDEDGRPLDIVHRDVSPDNLLLTCSGATKVVDFGTVKARHQEHTTKTGAIKGKVTYMAPELLLNQTVDRRGDIWALGVIAWELLTGQRLFKRDTEAGALHAVLHDAIPAPSSLRSDVSKAFDAPVLRALARDPAERHATARELGRALRKAGQQAARDVDTGDVQQWLVDELGHDAVCKRHGAQPRERASLNAAPLAVTSSPEALSPVSPVSPASLATEPVTAAAPVRRWPAALAGALVASLLAGGGWFASSVALQRRHAAAQMHTAVAGTLTRALAARVASPPETPPAAMVIELRDADDMLLARVPLDQLVVERIEAPPEPQPPVPTWRPVR